MTTTYEAQDCSLARALELVGERWTLLIIRDAFYGVRRFNHFRDHLDIPRAILVERLAILVNNGILKRSPDPEHAARYLYELTSLGCDLWPSMHALLCWGARVARPNHLRFIHVECGNEIDNCGNCESCDLVPAPTSIATEPRSSKTKGRTDVVAIALRHRHRLLDPLDVGS